MLTPQLYLVDYCSWLVCGLVVLAIPLPFVGVYSTVPMSAGATAIIAATAAGSLAIILLRGHRARRKAKDIARRDNAWTLVFDHAQLHDMRGSPLRDIDGGVLWVDSVGTVRVWATNGDETLMSFESDEIEGATSVHALRRFCYPTLRLHLSDSRTLAVRPVKPHGASWRSGMTHRECRMAAMRISPRRGAR